VLVFAGPRTLGELAAAEQVRPATMTRIAQSLVQDGYARREADPKDRRVVRLSATARGRRVMQQGRERRVANLARLLGRLPDEDVTRIHEAAELVERALDQ
jgi:DNA-binding MarR family transcriptional regulator